MIITPPLTGVALYFFQMLTRGARENFEKYGALQPLMFALKNGLCFPIPIDMSDDKTKDRVAYILSRLREASDGVGMVTEAWMAKASEGEIADLLTGKFVPVRKRSDKQECAVISIYTPERCISLMAKITRNPNRLSDWGLASDTADNKDAHAPLGRFSGLRARDN